MNSGETLENSARILILIGILLMVNVLVASAIIWLGTLFFYLSGHFRQKLQFAIAFRMQYALAAFLLWILIATFYSIAPWHDCLAMLWKYSDKLLLFFLLIPIFIEKKWRKIALAVFVIAILLNVVIYIVGDYKEFHIYGGVPPHAILARTFPWQAFSTAVAVVSYIFLYLSLKQKKWRILNVILFAFSIYFLFFQNIERVGMLTELLLLCVFILQALKNHGHRILAFLLLVIFAVVLYFSSSLVQNRINHLKTDFTARQDFTTSMGIRMAEMKFSYQLIQQKPLLGWGTGSFATLYQRMHPDDYQKFGMPRAPENGFLHITIQAGFIGLLLMFSWLFYLWKDLRHCLPEFEKNVAQALLLALLLLILTSSQFTAHFALLQFVVMVSVLLGAAFNSKRAFDKARHNAVEHSAN